MERIKVRLQDIVPIPAWLKKMRPGDPIEVTIRGTLTDVTTDVAFGPEHLVLIIQYGDPDRHAGQLVIHLPAEPGVSIKSFTAAPVSA